MHHGNFFGNIPREWIWSLGCDMITSLQRRRPCIYWPIQLLKNSLKPQQKDTAFEIEVISDEIAKKSENCVISPRVVQNFNVLEQWYD
jgi:hypothetical protein